jgi:hypothetical protein
MPRLAGAGKVSESVQPGKGKGFGCAVSGKAPAFLGSQRGIPKFQTRDRTQHLRKPMLDSNSRNDDRPATGRFQPTGPALTHSMQLNAGREIERSTLGAVPLVSA